MEHSKKYSEYLLSREWNERRQIALQRADYKCERCGERDGLEVHHKTYKHLGNEPLSDLIVLCKSCHWAWDEVRKWRRNVAGMLYEPRKKPRSQFKAEIEERKRAARAHRKSYAKRKADRKRSNVNANLLQDRKK